MRSLARGSVVRLIAIAAAAAAVASLGGGGAPGVEADAASSLNRPQDPVVLTGAAAPSFLGSAPGDIVAFRYTGVWQQVPVQVDERAVVDLGTVYNQAPIGVAYLTYADAGTYAGADADATLDADDEIVFMAKDAGGAPAAFSEPGGVLAGSGVQVTVTDPLNPSQHGHVFLFRQDGSLSPGAGQQYVTYGFNLLSGPYLSTYQLLDGPNPEDSSVTTPYYAHHFADRWVSDRANIYAGGASGVDILDRHKALFAPGVCVRSEDTFVDAEGAFIVNKSGPVRAIRSYIGANSGPLTQRQHVFYERRQDITTNLRVHAISGVMDFFDYSPDATGMTYYNSLNTGGVTIDGNPETPAAGPYTWEMVTGAQGSLTMAGATSTNISGFAYTSYYLDDTTPPVTQCTGDAFAYGSSGVWVNQNIPCTDPDQSCTNYLDTSRTMYYDPPGLSVATAQQRAQQAAAPLTSAVSAWNSGDTDLDGVIDIFDNCVSVANPAQTNSDANNAALGRGGADALGDECDPDKDGDGHSAATEAGIVPPKSDLSYCSRSRADIDADLSVSILDLSAVASSFAQAVPPAPERRDQDGDLQITILDLSKQASVFAQPVSLCP